MKTLEFSPAQEFSQALPRFSPGYEGTDRRACFFFLIYKIISFQLNKVKDDIQSAFYFFHETVNSHNLETASHIVHIIFVHRSAMKTHKFVDQSKRTYSINYFIKFIIK